MSTPINNAITDLVNNTTRVQAEQAATRRGSSELNQEAFLQLLMAQLRYQDPLNPIGNTEFLSQQAQLTQVSEMQKLNQSNSFAQASALIGRQVTLSDPEQGNIEITGTVAEARLSSKGTDIVLEDGSQFSAKLIKSIK